jgi:hypothetical protein
MRLVGSRCEWIGGRLSPPFFVNDRKEPYRPTLVLWMEQPSGLLVGHELIAPENAAGAVGRALRAALEHPLAGPARRPDVLRVSDAATAAEVRAAIGDSISVTVAPTPELDALLELMLKEMPGSGVEVSYLEGGRIPPAAIEKLFSAAELLYRMAPWKVATNGQVLRMDIPELGVEGACVSIIGSLGENLGVLVFPSLAGYEAFLRAAAQPHLGPGRRDAGTDWLALSFDRGADLSTTQRREMAAHGWRVADASAYPVVTRHDRDGASRPLLERDVKIAAACAASLTAFFVKHRNLFEADEFEPVCESWFDEHGLEVRFTIPYEAFELFEIESSPVREAARPARPGRNDPCYCGSGRKYKQCHLPLDEREDGTCR